MGGQYSGSGSRGGAAQIGLECLCGSSGGRCVVGSVWRQCGALHVVTVGQWWAVWRQCGTPHVEIVEQWWAVRGGGRPHVQQQPVVGSWRPHLTSVAPASTVKLPQALHQPTNRPTGRLTNQATTDQPNKHNNNNNTARNSFVVLFQATMQQLPSSLRHHHRRIPPRIHVSRAQTN